MKHTEFRLKQSGIRIRTLASLKCCCESVSVCQRLRLRLANLISSIVLSSFGPCDWTARKNSYAQFTSCVQGDRVEIRIVSETKDYLLFTRYLVLKQVKEFMY